MEGIGSCIWLSLVAYHYLPHRMEVIDSNTLESKVSELLHHSRATSTQTVYPEFTLF